MLLLLLALSFPVKVHEHHNAKHHVKKNVEEVLVTHYDPTINLKMIDDGTSVLHIYPLYPLVEKEGYAFITCDTFMKEHTFMCSWHWQPAPIKEKPVTHIDSLQIEVW